MLYLTLCMVTVYMWMPVTVGAVGIKLSPLEKQAILVFHSLFKESPELAPKFDNLLKASKLPDNVVNLITAGVTENPLTDYFVKSFVKRLDRLQNKSDNPLPGLSDSEGFRSVSTKILTTFLMGLLHQVMQAASTNPNLVKNGHLNTSALMNYVHPVELLQNSLMESDIVSSFLAYNASLVSARCYGDILTTMKHASAKKGWAIQMLDAMGKPTAGIMRGSLYFTGSYDECYMVKPSIEKDGQVGNLTATKSASFGTRFCRADFNIDKFVQNIGEDTKGFEAKLIWGMCVPDSCHKDDMKTMLELGVLDKTRLPVKDVYCDVDKHVTRDISAMAAIIVLAFFVLLVIAGSSYDVWTSKTQTEDQSRMDTKDTRLLSSIELGNVKSKGRETSFVAVPSDYDTTRENDNGILVISGRSTDNQAMTDDVKPRAFSRDLESQATQATSMHEDPFLGRLLLCFSAYTNIPRLLQAKQGKGAIGCIHGIRFLSLSWVVLEHAFYYGILTNNGAYTVGNLLDIVAVIQRFSSQTIIGTGYAVDTFFVLSAFLMTWLQLKETSRKETKLSIGDGVMFYFHRFWRLTPIYMIVLMTFTCLYPYVISGPFAPSIESTAENCKSTWWTNLLYINNLAVTDKKCMGWSWYLANDMQFYVISPIFLILMYMKPRVGAISTIAMMFLGIGLAFWKQLVYNASSLTRLEDDGKWWQNVHTVPWCRVQSWAVGMLLGMIVYKRGNTPIRYKIFNFVGWVLATCVAMFLVYLPYTENRRGGTEWTSIERAFYESVGRAAWCSCVAWVIFACHTGSGGLINSILSWHGFIPLSRLTYATYLVHPIVMRMYIYNQRTLLYVSDYNMVYLYIGHLVASHMVAFVFSLIFEAPFMQLEKVLLRTVKKKQT